MKERREGEGEKAKENPPVRQRWHLSRSLRARTERNRQEAFSISLFYTWRKLAVKRMLTEFASS